MEFLLKWKSAHRPSDPPLSAITIQNMIVITPLELQQESRLLLSLAKLFEESRTLNIYPKFLLKMLKLI